MGKKTVPIAVRITRRRKAHIRAGRGIGVSYVEDSSSAVKTRREEKNNCGRNTYINAKPLLIWQSNMDEARTGFVTG